jgi:hypothetical protein
LPSLETIAGKRRISIASCAIAARWNCHNFGPFGPDDAALSVIAPSRDRFHPNYRSG